MLLRALETGVDDPTLFEIGDGVLMAAWDEPRAELGDEPDDERGPVHATIDGIPAERCRATLRLALADGMRRTVLACRVPGHVPSRSGGTLALDRDDTIVARLTVDHLAPESLGRLVAGLDRAARARLIGFVLGVCRATFRLAAHRDFHTFARALAAASLTGEPIEFSPRAQLTRGESLYAAQAALPVGAITTVYLLDPARISESRCAPSLVAGESEVRLALVAPRVTGTARAAIIVGEHGALAATLAPSVNAPGIAALAEAGALPDGERRYVLRSLGQLEGDPEAAATARTIQVFAPEPVRDLSDAKRPVGAALELAVGCGAAGIFVGGWLRDPHDLVQGATLVSPFGEMRVDTTWHRLPRPDLAKRKLATGPTPGFVALAPIVEPIPVLQHRLRLAMAGGAIEIGSPLKVLSDVEMRDRVLGSVAGTEPGDALMTEIVAPATAELHRRAMARPRTSEIVDIGTMPRNPTVSFIIPLYRNLSFLRMQIGAFANDRIFHGEAELIYVLDSPEQRAELEHLLRGLHALTGLPFRLVVMAANFGYAAANNIGAAAARGRDLVLLNSDVIPLAPGWLTPLRARLPAAGAVGPKLLFDDGSLQHAGLTFEKDFEGRWYNTHFFKGYPRDWPAANVAREVPAVTGAAMVLPRAVFEEVGGFSEDYVIGDFEDSDLCLKIRATGRKIVYEPTAELHHFERRSIELHVGYTRTAASSYNRRLHAARWSAAMAALTRHLGHDSEPNHHANDDKAPSKGRRSQGRGGRR